MAKITIGTGLWANIRANLNAMFAELYDTIGSGGGTAGQYTQTTSLSAGVITRVTTTLETQPYSVMILDSLGNIITHTLKVQILLVGDVYVLDIYSSETLSNVKINIVY